MFILIVASLIATCFASSPFPNLVFKDGQCPQYNPSENFEPSQVYGKWYLLKHTDAGQQESGCCKCVEIEYEQGTDTQIKSHRKAYTLNGEEKVINSKFIYVSKGKYTYEYEDGGEYKQTHLTTTFNVQDNYLIVYGCLQKENQMAQVALVMSRQRNAPLPAYAQQTLQQTGLAQYYDVNQEGC